MLPSAVASLIKGTLCYYCAITPDVEFLTNTGCQKLLVTIVVLDLIIVMLESNLVVNVHRRPLKRLVIVSSQCYPNLDTNKLNVHNMHRYAHAFILCSYPKTVVFHQLIFTLFHQAGLESQV